MSGKEELASDDAPPLIAALGLDDWGQQERKLVRTLDLTMMPMLWVLYLFNYPDRTSFVHARLNSLEDDLGLVGNQFNTAVAVLTAGYALYMVSCWYTRKEIALRNMVLYTANYVASACSGLIVAAVFATLDGAMGLSGWKWLFIIEAAVGAVFAMIAMVLLPNYPGEDTGSASWSMTEDMRKLAVARIAADRVSEPPAVHTIWYGLRKALTDYKLYVFVLMNITISAAYAYNNFYPSIVRGLNLGGITTTLLLTAPAWLLACVGGVLVCYLSDKGKERTWHFLIPAGIALPGYIICIATLNNPVRYAASYLYISFLMSANPLVMTWAISTLSESPEKRARGTAAVNVLGQIGIVMAPCFFRPQDEPRYLLAFILMLTMAMISMSCAVAMRFILGRANKKLERQATENGTDFVPFTI